MEKSRKDEKRLRKRKDDEVKTESIKCAEQAKMRKSARMTKISRSF